MTLLNIRDFSIDFQALIYILAVHKINGLLWLLSWIPCVSLSSYPGCCIE